MQRGVPETDNQPDVVAVLSADHEEFRARIAGLRHPLEVAVRRRRFEELARQLARHETAEEEAVYPVLAQLGDEGRSVRAVMLDEERLANRKIAEALRLSLLRPGSRRFRQLVGEICDAVERHATHEEQVVFPLLRRTQEAAKLEMMSGWVRNATDFGPTRPHPHAPRHLGGLLAAGPALALLDRVRDLGRRLIER